MVVWGWIAEELLWTLTVQTCCNVPEISLAAEVVRLTRSRERPGGLGLGFRIRGLSCLQCRVLGKRDSELARSTELKYRSIVGMGIGITSGRPLDNSLISKHRCKHDIRYLHGYVSSSLLLSALLIPRQRAQTTHPSRPPNSTRRSMPTPS